MRLLITLGLSILCVASTAVPMSYAEVLSVAAYCELTIERLKLAGDAWSREGRGLTDEELMVLWQRYGVTAAEYYRFASENRAVLEDYLASRPDIAQDIERLSAIIKAVILQMEPR